jgi:hypothetical protein
MVAVKMGWVMVAESLFARDDLDPNIVNSASDHLLLYAVGHEIVESLLDRGGVDPNNVVGAISNYTALALACDRDLDDPAGHDNVSHGPGGRRPDSSQPCYCLWQLWSYK